MVGARFGRILSAPHGPGWLRGTLQWDFDLIPLFVVSNLQTAFGAEVDPIVGRWNFNHDAGGTTNYTAAQVGGVTSGKFISALWNETDTEETGYAFTFGTDSGLKTAPGWDNVTGVGTPNPKAFADSFRPATGE